jgi:transcriptional regulator with XRE-family HTH domain
MTQSQLAQAIGMSQNNLSRLENPEYGKHSLSTLKRIAEALDLALVVRFVPFSQYVAWLSGSPFMDRGISSESLAPANFEKEEKTGALEESKKYWERINGRLKNQRLWNVEPIEQASKPPKQEFESSPVWASDWRSHA